MEKNDGGPFFPHLMEKCQRVDDTEIYSGASLLDWFAGMAMQGFITHNSVEALLKVNTMAAMSYRIADAMLAEREK